ncbi:MAG TPA: DUF5916 domain-containing protein [Saprospiraceae bacterium]|nr:DUF5916 domain-containing protein [Saprospiraceae bacterium]HMQ81892.1 DUF5916 domain-containing protein [Saprospiraceae bacterium]
MSTKQSLTTAFVCLFCCLWQSQYLLGQVNLQADKKQLSAFRIDEKITLDGQLTEPIWQEAQASDDFVQLQPVPGAKPAQRSAVKILYDQTGLYVGAMLYDVDPDSVLMELSQRDNLGNTDWFGIFLDCFRDGINGVSFIVTPAGVQFDAKYSENGEDESWDAVWESATQVLPNGWVAEMKIPYSAIRFPKVEEQVWHLNFGRLIRRLQEKSFWNEIDPQQQGFLNQSGYLRGINNIKPPLRLQATPFVAVYGEYYYDKNGEPQHAFGRSFNGGMDVKFGLNESFTLDMTLVPDFGEAQSDNQVLNVSPFEIQFNENRAFFTEGTELFSKGDLFYSRRIGGTPLHYWEVEEQLADGEEIVENPLTAPLYNATKISGRTPKGLGLGLFNATEGSAHATIRDTEGHSRNIQTSPTTNYNVFVLDQNLPHNSSASFINTTVLRAGADYDANVSGTVFTLRNKANSYAISGKGVISQLYFSDSLSLGHNVALSLRKTSGNWQWGFNVNEESDTYNPRDLGFLRQNNERSVNFWTEYNIFKPFWIFNRGGVGFWNGYFRLYEPNRFQEYGFELWAWAQTKSFWQINVFSYSEVVRSHDYFETRTPDRYYLQPTNRNVFVSVSTDGRKKLLLEWTGRFRKFDEPGRDSWMLSISPRYRVNDKLSFRFTTNIERLEGDIGFVDKLDTDHPEAAIIFGRRDWDIVDNTLNASYNFNNRMALTFRLRHYWASLSYEDFHLLLPDGHLNAYDYTENPSTNFNAFNIDMIYRWRFAPGSDLFVIWKNSLLNSQDQLFDSYFDNLDQLFNAPQSNSLSIKMVYFLDYAELVKRG